MNPESIRTFVESCFTSFPLLHDGLGGSYEMDENQTFGSRQTALQCILFYASLNVCREFLDVNTLTRIFNEKVRAAVHPDSNSVLSSAEEEFATDILETFSTSQQISQKELKKLIISRVFVRNPPVDEISRGKSLLERILKIRPEHISDETVTDFMCMYLSHGSTFLGGNALNSMYLLLNLFSALNAPVPGRLAKPLGWTDKLASRLHMVYLIRRLVIQKIVVVSPTAPRDSFASQLIDFSRQIESPPRTSFVVPQLRAPLFHPQKSPDSPDSFRLSPKPSMLSPPRFSVPLATLLAGKTEESKSQREIIVEALQHSGMSPKRSARAADQFLAGGQGNVEALQATIEKSTNFHPIAQPSVEERTKLNDIQSMFNDIRNLAAVRSLNSSSRS